MTYWAVGRLSANWSLIMAGERIILLSDNHRYWDDRLTEICSEADQIWNAGDIGSLEVLEIMESIAPTRAVYGNIDDSILRRTLPLEQIFTVQGLKVYMIHIGGYPQRYAARIKARLDEIKPDLFISGHSHILKVMPDRERGLLHLNPGACGMQGFHHIRTLLRFTIEDGKILKPEAIELGLRGR